MIRLFRFKKNDLNPSHGKQIEYSASDVNEFFNFSTDEVSVLFEYCSIRPNDPLNGLQFHSTFKFSPARGDYKSYKNLDGSLNLKSFFLEKLHLNMVDNLNDMYALNKITKYTYLIVYIPRGLKYTNLNDLFNK